MKVGYIRVSTQEQNTIRQEVLMQALDVEQVFIDRMSGKNLARGFKASRCSLFPRRKPSTPQRRRGNSC